MNTNHTDWEPTTYDVDWTRQLIATIKQGGLWGIPMNASVYRLDHAKKTLVLVHGKADGLHAKVEKVFSKVGWKVQTETKE